MEMMQTYNLLESPGRLWVDGVFPPAYLTIGLSLLGTLLLSMVFFRRFLGVSIARTFLLWMITLTAMVVVSHSPSPFGGGGLNGLRWAGEGTWLGHPFGFGVLRDFFGVELLVFGLLMLVTGFVLKLWQKWVRGQLTEQEKLADMEGLRAWLSVGNVICAVGIAVLAALLLRASFVGVLLGLLLLVAAYPLLNILSQPVPPPIRGAEREEDLSAEREKVLKMLEEGKITAEESAELLNALGQTVHPPRAEWPAESPARQITLVGAGLVLLGYLLPWHGYVGFGDPRFAWAVLLAIAAAVVPYVVARWNPGLRSLVWVCLGVGGILLLSLITEGLQVLSFGLLVAVAGYVLVLLGTMRERAGEGT